MTTEAIRARLAALKISEDIADRSGLGDEWDGIDDAIKTEILDQWATIIMNVALGMPA